MKNINIFKKAALINNFTEMSEADKALLDESIDNLPKNIVKLLSVDFLLDKLQVDIIKDEDHLYWLENECKDTLHNLNQSIASCKRKIEYNKYILDTLTTNVDGIRNLYHRKALAQRVVDMNKKEVA
jgi:hypothetical protein